MGDGDDIKHYIVRVPTRQVQHSEVVVEDLAPQQDRASVTTCAQQARFEELLSFFPGGGVIRSAPGVVVSAV